MKPAPHNAVDRLTPRLECAVTLQRVQHGIDNVLADRDHRVGTIANRLNDFRGRTSLLPEQPEDQQLGNSIRESRVGLRLILPTQRPGYTASKPE